MSTAAMATKAAMVLSPPVDAGAVNPCDDRFIWRDIAGRRAGLGK